MISSCNFFNLKTYLKNLFKLIDYNGIIIVMKGCPIKEVHVVRRC